MKDHCTTTEFSLPHLYNSFSLKFGRMYWFELWSIPLNCDQRTVACNAITRHSFKIEDSENRRVSQTTQFGSLAFLLSKRQTPKRKTAILPPYKELQGTLSRYLIWICALQYGETSIFKCEESLRIEQHRFIESKRSDVDENASLNMYPFVLCPLTISTHSDHDFDQVIRLVGQCQIPKPFLPPERCFHRVFFGSHSALLGGWKGPLTA